MIPQVHYFNWQWIKRMGERIYLVDNFGCVYSSEYSLVTMPRHRYIIYKIRIKQK